MSLNNPQILTLIQNLHHWWWSKLTSSSRDNSTSCEDWDEFDAAEQMSPLTFDLASKQNATWNKPVDFETREPDG